MFQTRSEDFDWRQTTPSIDPIWCEVAPISARSSSGPIPGQLESRAIGPSDAVALRRALARSEAQCRRAAYLMAAAGHDLRQPLQVISLVLDRLTPDLTDPSRLEWVSIAMGEIARLSADLGDLATTARIREPEFIPVPLCDVLAAAATG
jgi:signal transduction histidine kinase